MERCRLITVINMIWIYQSVSSQTILNFDNCSFVNTVQETLEYNIKWDGHYRGIGCQVKFHGQESDDLYEYRICIKAIKWDFYDPSAVLKYYSSKSVTHSYNDLKRTYTQASNPSPETVWCSNPSDYVSVRLSNSGTVIGEITLWVYGEKTSNNGSINDSEMVGIIVGTVLGALLVIGIILSIVIFIYCKRRPRQSGNVCSNQNTTRKIITQQVPAGTIHQNISTTSLPSYEEVMTHRDKYMYREQGVIPQ